MTRSTDYGAALGQVLELAVLINSDMTRGLGELGLTQSRTHLLWELGQRGPSTQRALADALDVSPRNITGLVDALVATGFVSREPHPTDRRARLVQFTEHGAEVLGRMVTDHQEFARLLFQGMPTTTFTGFVRGLDSVLDRLRPLVSPNVEEVDDD